MVLLKLLIFIKLIIGLKIFFCMILFLDLSFEMIVGFIK